MCIYKHVNVFCSIYLPIDSIHVGYANHLTESNNEERYGACIAVKQCQPVITRPQSEDECDREGCEAHNS